MTIELVKILEAAQYHYKKALRWADNCAGAEDEESEIYWANASEIQMSTCRGLLEAYEIMTGRKIYTFEIEEELMSVA